LRRGLQAFLRLPTRDLLQWAVLVSLTIWTLGICLPFGWVKAGALTAVVVSILILSLSARQTFPALYTEFDKTTAWVCAAVHMLAATMFVAIAVVSLGWVPGAEGAPYTIETLKFWVVFLSVSLSVVGCFVLGYVVIMRLVRRLEYLSEHDALTGLLNRRAIEALMDKEAQRLHRFGDPFALLLIDVDHFKRIKRPALAMPQATWCSVRWRPCCRVRRARSTMWPGSAARSSACCCRAPMSRAHCKRPSASVRRCCTRSAVGRGKHQRDRQCGAGFHPRPGRGAARHPAPGRRGALPRQGRRP